MTAAVTLVQGAFENFHGSQEEVQHLLNPSKVIEVFVFGLLN